MLRIIFFNFFLLFGVCYSVFSYAQNSVSKTDTSLINLKLLEADKLILSGKYDQALLSISEAKKLSTKSQYTKGIASAICFEGIIAYNQSKFEFSITLLDSSQKLYSELGNAAGQSNALNLKAKALIALNRFDEANLLLKQAELLAEKNKDLKSLGLAYYVRGSLLHEKGQYAEAEIYFQKSLDIRIQQNDSVGIGAGYSYLGLNYASLGDYSKALDCIHTSIVIRNQIGDKRGLANSFLNQYKILCTMKEWEQALESEMKSLDLCTEIKDEQCISGRLTNIGELLLRLGKANEALTYQFRALKISRRIGIKYREALVLNNIGKAYFKLNDKERAFQYMDSSLAIRNALKDLEGLSDSYYTLAEANYSVQQYEKSIEYSTKCLSISEKLGAMSRMMEANRLLSSIYKATNEDKLALFHYERYINIRDSIFNLETSRNLTKKQLEFEFLQQQKIEELEQQHKDAVALQEVQRERFIRNALFIGLAVLVVVLFFVFRSNIARKRLNRNLRELNLVLQDQKQEIETKSDKIEQQHALIEAKNKEITDSIYYAKNIQSALMPHELEFSKHFAEHFILFKPKDIISGDFYWISEKENKVIFVTADCTGHGIPGGFMSMLGISLLNEIINEYALTEPGLVMSKLRKKLIYTLKQKGNSGEQQDGMDLTFLVIDKANMTLNYSTANHTFYIVREVDGVPTLLQFKGDKQPVGIYAGKLKPFTQTSIELKHGDIIYTMTDGYADQFGGPKGKKLKYKPLEGLLLSNSSMALKEQLEALDQHFEAWKRKLEQIDDVTILGVKI